MDAFILIKRVQTTEVKKETNNKQRKKQINEWFLTFLNVFKER